MSGEQIDLLEWLAAHPPGSPEVVPSSCRACDPVRGRYPVEPILKRADPACNMHRFYGLELATSFFGEGGVVCH